MTYTLLIESQIDMQATTKTYIHFKAEGWFWNAFPGHLQFYCYQYTSESIGTTHPASVIMFQVTSIGLADDKNI